MQLPSCFPEKDHSRRSDTLGCPKEHNFYGLVNETQAQGLLAEAAEWEGVFHYVPVGLCIVDPGPISLQKG